MIKLSNIEKRIGSFKLQDISFELPAGYILGLVGENGAGKTTLLSLIAGLYQQDEGTVDLSGSEDYREDIGVVLHGTWFDDRKTLENNAAYYGSFFKNYSPDKLKEYMKRFDLAAGKKYKALSKGEKLKFSLAFALAKSPKLLLLDEPTANFDKEFRTEFWAALKEFIADGTRSVIISSHLTGDLDYIADYLLYIESGKTLIFDDIESVRESYRIVAGEEYKVKLLADRVICMEKGQFATKALVTNSGRPYDESLVVTTPTLEELMYFISKRKGAFYYEHK